MNFPRVIYKGNPKKNSWCRWSVFRVTQRNNSTNVRFVGDTGSGKTWSAISFAEICAEMMNKKFTVDRIYFSLKDLIDEVAENDPRPGSIFLIDEQQIAASSKAHQSKRNRAYSAFLSTVRSKRYIIISTLPYSDMEDKQTRRLFQVEIEAQGANLSTQTVKCKPRYVEHSRIKKDKIYWKRLVITFRDEVTGIMQSKKLDYWHIPKPSQDLIDAYEIKKKEFQKILYKRLSHELGEEEGREDSNPKAVAQEATIETLTGYQQAILRHMQSGVHSQKEINSKILAEGEFNSSPEKVSLNVKWMKRKGVILLR